MVDPMGEYAPLVRRLGGQVIEIAPDSPQDVYKRQVHLPSSRHFFVFSFHKRLELIGACTVLGPQKVYPGRSTDGVLVKLCIRDSGRAVAPDGRQTYCSVACAKAAHRRQQREYMRKKRG